MTVSVSEEIFHKHYEIFQNAINNNPEKIFHYTTSTSLASILKTKKLWFSNVKFLNDENENKQIFYLLNKYIQVKTGYFTEDYRNEIKYLSESLIENPEAFDYRLIGGKNTYVASFSTQPDQLNLWSYYTKTIDSVGYNIEFDPRDLVKYSYNGKGLAFYGKVIYDENEQLSLLEPLIKDFYTKYLEISEEAYKNMLIQELITILSEFSLFFKVKDFEQEEEYRFVWKTSKKAKIREYKNIFIPYVEYALPMTSIKSITVSPTQKNKIVEMGLNELLLHYIDEEDFGNIEVKTSRIPLRY